MTMCNVLLIVTNLQRNITPLQLSSTEHFSIFQLIVLVLWPAAFILTKKALKKSTVRYLFSTKLQTDTVSD